MDIKRLFAALALTCASALPSMAISGESEDVKLCAEVYKSITAKELDPSGVKWTAAIFSSNKVVFPRSNVVCEVWVDRVESLSEGNVLYISDGWPMDRKKVFEAIEGPISKKRSQLKSEISRLDELEEAAEDLLKATSSTQDEIARMVERVEEATGVPSEVDLSGLDAGTDMLPAPGDAPATVEPATGSQATLLDIFSHLDEGRLDRALEIARRMDIDALTERDKSQIIAATERVVRPLPARDVKGNLAGYEILSMLEPDNKRYAEKVRQYSDRLVLSDAPSLNEMSRELSDQRTRLQRDAFWEQVEGKTIEISGTVTEVNGGGLLTGPYILIQTKIGRLSARCVLSDGVAQQNVLVAIDIGDRVSCRGEANNYTLIFNTVEVVIRDGKI